MTRRAFFAFVVLGLLVGGNSFAQEKSTTISGVVQGADGKPLAKARVYLQPSDGRAPHTVVTDAEGRYQFANLRAGLYDLKAHANGAWTELERNINVHAKEDVTVNLKFKPPAATPTKPPQ
ncbi:MAG: carboxypeptidase-like regulatory domain-containing protein [Candidatus Acidiferrales bacterium]